MMKLVRLLILLIVFTACNTEVKKELVKEKLVMYTHSEMALLMEEFYTHNEKLKDQIMQNAVDLSFPMEFENIHTANLTTASDRDEIFNNFAKNFIAKQKAVYQSKTKKESFNTMVASCIACHKIKCTGPLVRINKLLIQ